MERKEALEKFQEETADSLQKEMKLLEENNKGLEGWLKEQLFSNAGKLIIMAEFPIGYVQFSLLRSLMDEDVYRLMVSIYGKDYFQDLNFLVDFIDISRLFAPLKEMRYRLYETARNYQGKIELFDCDRMIRELAMKFFKSRAESCRRIFRDFDRQEFMRDISLCPKLIVKWGEHKEYSETVFLKDNREKETGQFLTVNQNNTIHKWDGRYVYQSWENTRFEDMIVSQKNLLFLMMRNSYFKNCQWESSLLHGASFRENQIEKTVFVGCDLTDCDFREVNFYQSQFINCDLSGADFTGADIKETDFSGSRMENARFSRTSLSSSGLTAGQLQQIYLEEDPYVFYHGIRQKDPQ